MYWWFRKHSLIWIFHWSCQQHLRRLHLDIYASRYKESIHRLGLLIFVEILWIYRERIYNLWLLCHLKRILRVNLQPFWIYGFHSIGGFQCPILQSGGLGWVTILFLRLCLCRFNLVIYIDSWVFLYLFSSAHAIICLRSLFPPISTHISSNNSTSPLLFSSSLHSKLEYSWPFHILHWHCPYIPWNRHFQPLTSQSSPFFPI